MAECLGVLVTGATGFLGARLLKTLHYISGGSPVRGSIRGSVPRIDGGLIGVGEIDANTVWDDALRGVKVVIHCAARIQTMANDGETALAAYREVNTLGTLNLARQAAAAGVSRFIFISSIKVNGERTDIGKPFSVVDIPSPEDPYGISKYEAERGLRDLAVETGMEIVIIRPPLVYGFGVKGNFESMIRLVAIGLPLPLGAVHNKRSLVALDNLVDLIVTCIHHPAATNQTFLVSDGQDLSTTELLCGVSEAMSKPSRLIPVSAGLLQLGATLLGKKAIAQRLLGSLQVDISHTQECLGWKPPLTVKQGLNHCFKTNQD